MSLVRIYETVLDSSGHPAATGTLDVYLRGTTTHASLFSDSGGSTATTNPLTITNGLAAAYVAAGSYDLVATVGGTASPTAPLEAILASGVATLDSTGLVPLSELPSIVASTSQTANYTFALADAGSVVEANSAAAITFTIPPHATVAWPVGTYLEVFQFGAGQVTFAAGAGVTLRSDANKVHTTAQYATVGLRNRAIDDWVLSGDLS